MKPHKRRKALLKIVGSLSCNNRVVQMQRKRHKSEKGTPIIFNGVMPLGVMSLCRVFLYIMFVLVSFILFLTLVLHPSYIYSFVATKGTLCHIKRARILTAPSAMCDVRSSSQINRTTMTPRNSTMCKLVFTED